MERRAPVAAISAGTGSSQMQRFDPPLVGAQGLPPELPLVLIGGTCLNPYPPAGAQTQTAG